MRAGGSYQDSLASVTLNESKELLKERLDAIMGFKKKSKDVICATLILTLAICCGAAYVGAYAAPVPTMNMPTIADTIPQAGENGQSPSLPAPSIIPSRDSVKVSFAGVYVTGQGPVGVELVRTKDLNVTFDFLNLDNPENCTTKADIVNGIMQITVNHNAPNGINVNFGPDYQNVVRVLIPDAIYTKFEIQSKEMVVQMQDFNAPVHVESNRAGFWLIDDIISQGTYDIEVTSGPIYIEADTILRDITANADNGPITLCFNKAPTNLYLDSTNCGPIVERPDDWPTVYKVGNEQPRIILNNTGKTVIKTILPSGNDGDYKDAAMQTVVYDGIEMRQYEGENGHPYIHEIRTNHTTHEITGYQRGMLAFDKDGNPLKIDWWSLDTELDSEYFNLYENDTAGIPAGGTDDAFGGWSLNVMGEDLAVSKIAFVLYCDKEITFEDGTVWKNPDFDTWRSAFEGKKVDVDLLESYYPYEHKIAF